MTEPHASARPSGPLPRVLGSVLGLARAHVGLIGIELEEAREHLVKALVLALFGIGALLLCLLTLTLALVLGVDADSRPLVVTILASVYLLAGVVCLVLTRRVLARGPQLFGDTMEQLRRDQERLLP